MSQLVDRRSRAPTRYSPRGRADNAIDPSSGVSRPPRWRCFRPSGPTAADMQAVTRVRCDGPGRTSICLESVRAPLRSASSLRGDLLLVYRHRSAGNDTRSRSCAHESRLRLACVDGFRAPTHFHVHPSIPVRATTMSAPCECSANWADEAGFPRRNFVRPTPEFDSASLAGIGGSARLREHLFAFSPIFLLDTAMARAYGPVLPVPMPSTLTRLRERTVLYERAVACLRTSGSRLSWRARREDTVRWFGLTEPARAPSELGAEGWTP